MALMEVKLCDKILNENFGDIVAKVGEVLMKKGCNSLRYICSATQLHKSLIQEALSVLINHNLVTWDEKLLENTEYKIHVNKVLLFLRFPRYVSLIRDVFGEEAEMVVDLLLKVGQATSSQLVIHSVLKLLDASEEANAKLDVGGKVITVRNSLEKLINDQFIQRCPARQDSSQNLPVLKLNEEDLYRFDSSSLDLKLLQDEIKEHRLNAEQTGLIQTSKTIHTHPDKDIFWRINFDRFHLEIRDIEMRNCISRRIDSLAGACFSTILKVAYRKNEPWTPTLNSILATEIRDSQKEFFYMDQYLKIIAECEGRFFRKVGDAGGGEYILDVSNLIRTITLSHIDNIVRERYGSKAARIFRLVRETGMMEQDRIAEVSMISSKEANLLTHILLNDNFFRLYEIRKGITPTPANKNVYLFFVDTSMLVRKLLQWAYKTVYNLIEHRNMRLQQNTILLARKARLEMILENLRQSGSSTEEQIQEIEELLTPNEKELVKNVIEVQESLTDCESESDETIFLLQMFLYYEYINRT